MFIDFGQKKCPLCGDRGIEVEKGVFTCSKCEVTFNDFSIVAMGNKQQDKMYCN